MRPRLRLRSQPLQKFGSFPEAPEEAVLASDTPYRMDSATVEAKAFKIGGGVSAPRILKHVNAQFSEQARRAKYQGVCLISLIIDAHGMPQDVKVKRALGMGLDEKAIEAIRNYRFTPAMKSGKPVASYATMEVSFRLY